MDKKQKDRKAKGKILKKTGSTVKSIKAAVRSFFVKINPGP